MPDINYTMYLCKAHKFCTFHLADILLQCMMFNLHDVIGCHCAVKRDCIYHLLLPFPSITGPKSKQSCYSPIILSSETGNEPFYSSVPSVLCLIIFTLFRQTLKAAHTAVLISTQVCQTASHKLA